jgi:uncharacterized protein (DUF2342 family)
MPVSVPEVEEAHRLRLFISVTCVEIHADCVRMRDACADQVREAAAMRERMRVMRRAPDATQQQMDSA